MKQEEELDQNFDFERKKALKNLKLDSTLNGLHSPNNKINKNYNNFN